MKCEPLTTFVYQLNQSTLLSAIRSPATGASDGEPQRRSTSPHFGGKLADACAAVQAFDEEDSDACLRESSLLFLLLMLGTVWLGLSLYNFTKTSVHLVLLYLFIMKIVQVYHTHKGKNTSKKLNRS